MSRFSKFAFVLVCYTTNHLLTGPLGNSVFCFPRNSMVHKTKSDEVEGNILHRREVDQLALYKHGVTDELN